MDRKCGNATLFEIRWKHVEFPKLKGKVVDDSEYSLIYVAKVYQ